MPKFRAPTIEDLPPPIQKKVQGFFKELLKISPYASVTVDMSVSRQVWVDEVGEEDSDRHQLELTLRAHSKKKSKKHRDAFAKLTKEFLAEGWESNHKKQKDMESEVGEGGILYKNSYWRGSF